MRERLRGPALASLLIKLRPELGLIYMSGYAADYMSGYAAEDLAGLGGVAAEAGFLPKPFTSATLVEAVATAIRLARKRTSDRAADAGPGDRSPGS